MGMITDPNAIQAYAKLVVFHRAKLSLDTGLADPVVWRRVKHDLQLPYRDRTPHRKLFIRWCAQEGFDLETRVPISKETS